MCVSSKLSKVMLSLLVQETLCEALVQPGLNCGSDHQQNWTQKVLCKSRTGRGMARGTVVFIMNRSVSFCLLLGIYIDAYKASRSAPAWQVADISACEGPAGTWVSKTQCQ